MRSRPCRGCSGCAARSAASLFHRKPLAALCLAGPAGSEGPSQRPGTGAAKHARPPNRGPQCHRPTQPPTHPPPTHPPTPPSPSPTQWRVVFDEGHALKNPAAGQTRAAVDLAAANRWVVTGAAARGAWRGGVHGCPVANGPGPPPRPRTRGLAPAPMVPSRPTVPHLCVTAPTGTPIGGDASDLAGQLAALCCFPLNSPQCFADT